MFDLYANIRPAKSYPGLPAIGNADLVIARENTEDLYGGIEFEMDGGAVAMRVITERASRRIAKVAASLALARKKKVTIVHKANVMKKTCGLFAHTVLDELRRFPEIEVDQMYVDAASAALVKKPETFDVIVTTNMFGDILSDLAAQVAGGLGMAASANVGESAAIFEPIHGSAPDITGLNTANPYSMIQSVRMMFDWLAQRRGDKELRSAAEGIDSGVRKALEMGFRTPDIGGKLGTEEVGRKVAAFIGGRA
jgi:3-isopropylmalate dehydrogenase